MGNDNPFVGQPFYSKHVCEQMRGVNELEADSHWVQTAALEITPNPNALFVGSYMHEHRGRTYYFVSAADKQVWTVQEDGHVLYTWNVPMFPYSPDWTPMVSYVLYHALTASGRRSYPHWSRSVCVGADGHIYIGGAATYYRGITRRFDYFVYQFAETGQIVRTVRFNQYTFGSGFETTLWGNLYARSCAIAVHGNVILCAQDPIALKQHEDDPVFIPSRLDARNIHSGNLLWSWISPEYEWSAPDEEYAALKLAANDFGVFYFGAREESEFNASSGTGWRYAIVGKDWSGETILLLQDRWVGLSASTSYSWHNIVRHSNGGGGYNEPGQLLANTFTLSDNHIFVRLVKMVRSANRRYWLPGGATWIQIKIAEEELSEEEIEAGATPGVAFTPQEQISFPLRIGGEFCDGAITGHPAAGREWGDIGVLNKYELMQPHGWYAYSVNPDTRESIGTLPDDNALAFYPTVAASVIDVRDALEHLVETARYWTHVVSGGQHPISMDEDHGNLLLRAMASPQSYGLEPSPFWNPYTWRHSTLSNHQMHDVDIGQVYECVRYLKNTARRYQESAAWAYVLSTMP